MASKLIPKIIHQSYLSGDLPKKIEENIKKIKRINNTWEYRFYSERDIVSFIQKHYSKDIIEAYNKINPEYGAARADFFRYLLLYKEGGLWLDIKSTIKRPLDSTLKKDDYFILSQWQNKMGEKYQGYGLCPELNHIPGGEFQQWHILTAPKNPAIKKVIENTILRINNYDIKTHGIGRRGVLLTTGPIIYTLSILSYLKDIKHRFVDIENEFKIEYTVFNKHHEHNNLFKKHYSKLTTPVVLKNNKERI